MRPVKNQNRLTVVAVCLIAIGTAVRLYLYFKNPSPWLDEQQLSLNIAGRSFIGLIRELDFAQSAPLLFLWMIRVAVALTGVNELALRFIPMVAGVLLLPAIWVLTRRLLSDGEALFALAFAAVSPVLIRYSNEIKPYSIDALTAVALIWLALNCNERPDEKRSWMLLGLAGIGAVWLSTPAAFVLAAIGVTLLLQLVIARRWREVVALSLLGTLWLASFALAYLEIYRPAARNEYMQRFWAGSFMHLSIAGIMRDLAQIVGGMISAIFLHRDVFTGVFTPARSIYVGLFVIMCIVGAWRCSRDLGYASTSLLALPFIVGLLASAAHRYPLSVRLMLFAAPAFIIFTAAGLAWLWKSRLLTRWRPLAGALLIVLLLPAVGHSQIELRHSDRKELARTVITRLQSIPGDTAPAYLFSSSLASWLLYTTDWAKPDTARLMWITRMARQPGGPISYNAPSRKGAVTAEGDTYKRLYKGRLELYGIPSGMEETSTRFPEVPDPGWAENEARRIGAAANPCAWLVAVHYHRRELEDLVHALAIRRLTSTTIEELPGAALVRSCMSTQRKAP